MTDVTAAALRTCPVVSEPAARSAASCAIVAARPMTRGSPRRAV
jgi:hypothetical protein